ncbi:MAG: metalloregulator ArsR/SmtB family transcription factor [Candidatus Omnitrophota bacterium]
MKIKKIRQVLKSLADDTRLRIVNLLKKRELNVTQMCQILHAKQSNISKHLSRLRLTGVVGDRRKGLNVCYYLAGSQEKAHKELINLVTSDFIESEVFKRDADKLKQLTKNLKRI